MGEKIAAIVLAAGEGKRMGSGIPKQYMLIKSRPLVYYALKAFEESAVDEVILVTGEDEIDYCKEYIVDRYHFNKVKKIVRSPMTLLLRGLNSLITNSISCPSYFFKSLS